MIVVTATLIFVLLFFAPIRFGVRVVINIQNLSASLSVRSLTIKIFDEDFELNGKVLHCEGAISTNIDLSQVDKQTGIDFLKCITVDKVAVSLANNVLEVPTTVLLVENALTAILIATFCNISHCQFYAQVVGTLKPSHARVESVITTSVAELSFCLIKQGVKLWKTQTSKKS